jgi:Zn-dependent protease with chaperone function
VIAAAGLLAYAALLLGCGFPALARASWPDRAPRLAAAAWLALAWSAVASVVLGGVALMVPTARVSDGIAWLLAACETALRTRYAHPGGAVPDIAGSALAATVTVRMAWAAGVTLWATARVGRRHRRRLRIAGRPDTRLGAVIVDHGEPAAYCLPGARRPVVLTSAAVRLLDDRQLTAVLAHERAHQAGRHHLLVALAAVPAAAFPFVPALRHARHEVARLAELAADDAAAARAPRLALAEALLALGTAPLGTGALGAGGSTAAARVRRLIAAPDPLSRAATALGAIAVTGLIAFPLVLLAGPAITILGISYCPLPRLPPLAKCRHAEGSRRVTVLALLAFMYGPGIGIPFLLATALGRGMRPGRSAVITADGGCRGRPCTASRIPGCTFARPGTC